MPKKETKKRHQQNQLFESELTKLYLKTELCCKGAMDCQKYGHVLDNAEGVYFWLYFFGYFFHQDTLGS